VQFTQSRDVRAFYDLTRGALLKDEAQNLVLLGNLILGIAAEDKSGWRDPANWFMASVSSSGGLRLVALMTPPHNLTLYEVRPSDEALACLAEGLRQSGVALPGVMAERSLAERFARTFSADWHLVEEQRIYELKAVNPAVPLFGKLRPACEDDLPFLPFWLAAFDADCFNRPISGLAEAAERARAFIARQSLYLLELDGVPVSMAEKARPLRAVCGVSHVYTPPFFRGGGYASACVAQLSGRILESGFSSCALYTNLANPVSNKIYQNIGYVPIADSSVIRFNSP
jgi:predicted GNAT family acetyltransferase